MVCAACGTDLLPDEAGVTIGSKVVHEECAGLLGVAPLVKTQAKAVPTSAPAPVPEVKPTRPPPPAVETNGAGTFPIVLDGRRRVEVPLEFGEDDLEFVFGVMDLYVKRRAKQRGAP